MTKKAKPKLTEAQWSQIFEIRCRSKRGQAISQDELRLCERAIAENGSRYSVMHQTVFDATHPCPVFKPRG